LIPIVIVRVSQRRHEPADARPVTPALKVVIDDRADAITIGAIKLRFD
jgi:hypothetical protein